MGSGKKTAPPPQTDKPVETENREKIDEEASDRAIRRPLEDAEGSVSPSLLDDRERTSTTSNLIG